MHWVLQNNLFNEAGFQRLLDTLERLGLPHSLHKVVPFVGDLSPEPEIPKGGRVIVMGSYSMAKNARRRGWSPGSFDSINLDYERQVPHWGDRMLNSDALVCRFADVPEQPVPFFIRPTLDSKSFSGMVTDWPSFYEWQQRVLDLGADNGGTLDGDTLVQVCSKKVIYREYRLWVIKGQVVTASLYKEGTRVRYSEQVDEAVIAYGEETAHLWSPDEAYVLDIADTPDGLRVLEAGCLNAAGFYAADMQKLVMALEDTFGGSSSTCGA